MILISQQSQKQTFQFLSLISIHNLIQLFMKKDELQYSIGDLARALLREFLSQNGLKQTLLAFEKEDSSNKKKINKNLLVELVSMKSLYLLNKQTSDSQPTLLETLVSYLHKKYLVKQKHFSTTNPNVQFLKYQEGRQQKKINSKQELKDRPQSGKALKGNNFEVKKTKTVAPLEKDELKLIYQKLSKKEDYKDFRIVGSAQVRKTEERGSKQGFIKTEVITTKNQISSNTIEAQQSDYNDAFQEDDTNAANQYKNHEKAIIQQPIIINKKIEQNKNFGKKEQKAQQIPLLVKNISNEAFNKQNVSKKLAQTSQQQKYIEKKQQNLIFKNSLSEQKINPTPILHTNNQIQQIRKQNTSKFLMGSSASVVKVQLQSEETQLSKGRTLMRPSSNPRIVQQTTQKKVQQEQQMRKPAAAKACQLTQQIIEEVKHKEEIIQRPIEINQVGEKAVEKAPVMMVVGKKRKNKQEANLENYPTKFKFDENFTHQIQKEAVYQYKQYDFGPIVINQNAQQICPGIVIQSQLNYKIKGGGVQPFKKRPEKTIASKDADRLRKIVFQSSQPTLPKSWNQGFILSPHQETPYGLKQIQGGPCGIIAAVQCYFLKHLLFCSGQMKYNDQVLRQVCLAAALTNLLWKVRSIDKLTLAFPPRGAIKIDISNLRVVTFDAPDFISAFAGVWAYRQQYIGNSNHGVASLLYSAVLTKGIDMIESEMDIKQNPLIGNHGHCTQQFVNLLLTGKATSNCFDGIKLLDDYKLQGISNVSQFGFLTIFQTLKYIEVGKNLKNPIFPVWVICKEFHYHVIFASNYLIAENNKTPMFDIVYFDGLYNCGDKIRLTLQNQKEDNDKQIKLKDLPLIEQVMMTKWGRKKVNWNGSTVIL